MTRRLTQHQEASPPNSLEDKVKGHRPNLASIS